MSTFAVSFEAILRHALTELGLPDPTFQYETRQDRIYTCKVFYIVHDQYGREFPYDICATSPVSHPECRKHACYAALKSLQRMHGLIIVDYNYSRLQVAQAEYLSCLAAYKDNILIPYTNLLEGYTLLKRKIAAASDNISRLQPIVDRIHCLFS
ncbi:hypothetical protein M5689_024732 [Euphorbia peplus]|nr:hypothetical protein M5689_024732 [Euphorbia peplus]